MFSGGTTPKISNPGMAANTQVYVGTASIKHSAVVTSMLSLPLMSLPLLSLPKCCQRPPQCRPRRHRFVSKASGVYDQIIVNTWPNRKGLPCSLTFPVE